MISSQFTTQTVPTVAINSGSGDMLNLVLNPAFWIGLFVAFLIFVGLLFLGRYLFLRFTGNVKEATFEKKALDAVVYEVRLPKANEVEIQAADQMFSGLLGISEALKGKQKYVGAKNFVSFEIIGLPETIKFYVVSSKAVANTVEKAINGAYPTAEVTKVEEYNIFNETSKVDFTSLKLEKDSYKPVRTYEELSTDSLSPILTTMSKIKMGEAAALQVIITGAGSGWRESGKKYVQKVRHNNSDPEKKKMDAPEDMLAAIEKKCEKGGFYVDIRLVSVANTMADATQTLNTMTSSFSQYKKEGSNQFVKAKLKKGTRNAFVRDFIYRIPRETSILNTAELATIIHFPNKMMNTPHINWLLSKRAPATAGIPTSGDLWLGNNFYRDVDKPIYMIRDDRRRHMYMVGKTGSGKSYMLQQMALQDIINGEGIAFLDPHGDSAEWLLERIPPHRIEDVIYWDPSDTERPLGFNIIEFYDEQDKHRVVNAILGMMQKMFDPHNQGITGPRFERAVRNAMLTVMEDEGSTLVEVLRILSDQNYANKKIPNIKDDLVRRYWTDEIANTQEFHKSEVLGYIVSKFDRFVTNKLARNIFGQSKSGFNMRWIMDNQKILIVNLSKGLIGEENAQFLGLLLVPKILSSAMSRADIRQDDRKDFYLYVDEFQNFSTEDFAQILSEARKYRLNLIVANQYITQIDEKIRDAVFGNVGSVITFKVGNQDAQFLESIYAPIFDATDLVNLENVNAYVKLIYQGESPPAFSINTNYKFAPFNIPKDGDKKTADVVKNLSRYRYGRDRALVEAEMRERARMDDESPSPKSGMGAMGLGGFGGAAGGFNAPLKPKSE
jgi:hypothetical protein